MHFYTRLGLLAAAVLSSSCQTGLSGLKETRVGSNATSTGCLDYQPCRIEGELYARIAPGERIAATITRNDGICVPLLLGKRQFRGAASLSGRAVSVEGLALVRFGAMPAETLELAYFDRWLIEGLCSRARTVLYVRSLQKG